ncbi:hypothetical protein [Puniceibacterium sp. IMCC21224]|uniref:hypothetical protein n=1 Tax=Puniceibacterium sp. IMCC21224 TaxID=1618204 RepID=UPI00065D4A51|nr:hypothetical protein [Puniceibacterium sp. IMCC21224]KMK63960.1 hypothetical protein IMCC21224_1618 [Puniceibacterium sp. IMCC21224]
MKIAIYGASVSAQTIDHATGAVTGYAEVLRREHMAALGATEIRQFTYGGNRASDGGLALLKDVIAYQPDICLFEPLIEDMTRGTRISEGEIRYIYRRLLKAGICPVTLMLPLPEQGIPDGLPEFFKYCKICDDHGLPIVRVNVSDVTNIPAKFNDIHTRHAGARIYADQIVDQLTKLGGLGALWAGMTAPSVTDDMVYVRRVAGSAARSGSLRRLQMRLVLEKSAKTGIRIVQQQTIGPFSPVLDVAVRGKPTSASPQWHTLPPAQIRVWDTYCHYPRETFVTMADFHNAGHSVLKLDITCSETDPNYDTCRRKVASWPARNERVMKPIGPITVITQIRLQSAEAI